MLYGLRLRELSWFLNGVILNGLQAMKDLASGGRKPEPEVINARSFTRLKPGSG